MPQDKSQFDSMWEKFFGTARAAGRRPRSSGLCEVEQLESRLCTGSLMSAPFEALAATSASVGEVSSDPIEEGGETQDQESSENENADNTGDSSESDPEGSDGSENTAPDNSTPPDDESTLESPLPDDPLNSSDPGDNSGSQSQLLDPPTDPGNDSGDGSQSTSTTSTQSNESGTNGNGTNAGLSNAGGAALTLDENSNGSSGEDVPLEALQTQGSAQDVSATAMDAQLTADEVQTILGRAAAASDSQNAIIAIVDRQGNLLGVRVEQEVLDTLDEATLVFAIDGAIAKARTAAYFANDQAPLTSRTVRSLSETTITEREVESNPNIQDPSSTIRGPGTVAPIGVGGHFPPGVLHTPVVDLFDIEHTNRDSLLHPGNDLIKGTPDDILLDNRFNADFIAGQEVAAPESYGFSSGIMPDAQGRGLATLPGGIPIYRDSDLDGLPDTMIGGIGVFFPGENGYASFEQGFVPNVGQTALERYNSDLSLEAEFIAFAAIGGSSQANARVGTLDGIDAISTIDLPFGRIDLVGLSLEIIGPTPGIRGVDQLLDFSNNLNIGAAGSSTSGADQPIAINGPGPGDDVFYQDGVIVPDGWLVAPKDSLVDDLTAADVVQLVQQGIDQAQLTRAAIRLPLSTRVEMMFAVTDTSGEVLGLFRMPDTTYFSIDVAVTKARNVAYYADAAALQPVDQVPGVDAGVAFTNRTFRFLAEPRFPSGVDNSDPPAFSILNDPGVNPVTAENLGAPTPASDFQTALGFTRFNPFANFRDPGDVGVNPSAPGEVSNINQSGVIYFPGSTPIYKNGVLVGGLGVSGDGVDQDDVVTFMGAQGFLPDNGVVRADEVIVNGTRLPYQKFLRNPEG